MNFSAPPASPPFFMCTRFGDNSAIDSPDLPRRNFLKLACAAALSFGSFGRSRGADINAPKRQNLPSPNAALARRREGNDRYVAGKMNRHDPIAELPALAM